MQARLIARAESGVSFWTIGEEVYRVQPGSPKDANGLPMDRRWECSVAHWNRFREVFSWAADVNPKEDA
jgi:hypothetical protein